MKMRKKNTKEKRNKIFEKISGFKNKFFPQKKWKAINQFVKCLIKVLKLSLKFKKKI